MTNWLPRFMALLVFVLSIVPVLAAAPTDAEIARLIKQLGSDEFAKREAAGKELVVIGEPARAALEKAAASADDEEIRERAAGLIKAINAKLQIACYDLHSEAVLGAVFAPDNRHVISASYDGTVRYFDATTKKLVHCFAHPVARSVAISPDGKLTISSGNSGNQALRVWDLESGKEVLRIADYPETVDRVVFSPDGEQVLYCCIDGVVRLFDISEKKELKRFAGHSGRVHSVAFFAGGTRSLSAGYDRTVRQWDHETGKETRRLEGHAGQVWDIAVSPDDKWAASSGQEKVIKVWDLESGLFVCDLAAHADSIHSLAWSSDGRRLASGSFDRTIVLWNTETFAPLHRFEGHTDKVYCVSFSPDGRYLVSGSTDKTVRVWRVPK